MKTFTKFVINEAAWLEVAIAGFGKNRGEGINSPLEVYRFDLATISLCIDQQVVMLYQGTAQDLFFRSLQFLGNASRKECIIPTKKYIGIVGRHHIIDEYKYFKYEKRVNETLDYIHFLLYGWRGLDTWIYSDQKQVYLEVGHALFAKFEPNELPNDPLVKEYVNSYKPLGMVSFSYEAAREWFYECSMIVKSLVNDTYCCLGMASAIENPIDSPLHYDPCCRDYTISAPNYFLKRNEVWIGFSVSFCPFCGAKLPNDLVEERMDILEKEYGIDDVYDDKQKKLIPQEFMTDEWWKKRGL